MRKRADQMTKSIASLKVVKQTTPPAVTAPSVIPQPVAVVKTQMAPTIEVITPETATSWLNSNTHNRPIVQKRIDSYAAEMKAGRWVENGESIKFSADGVLLDGQHRLWACVYAERAFTSLVVRGITDERAFATVDVGAPRTHGHIFALGGFKDCNNMAAASQIIYNYDNRTMNRDKITHLSIPKQELLKWAVVRKVKLESCLKIVGEAGGGTCRFIPKSALIALLYIFSNKNESQAVDFITGLITGANLLKSDPCYALREKLIWNTTQSPKLPTAYLIMLAIKAWNKSRDGEKCSKLFLTDDETFIAAI